ncbi:hypothetical protein [Paraburkholderia panacisoli]|nr:hypothetical protein [Paraburkholderia panacisoli]
MHEKHGIAFVTDEISALVPFDVRGSRQMHGKARDHQTIDPQVALSRMRD